MPENEIHLYGSVGGDFWDEDYFTAMDVRTMLENRTGPLTVRLNSGGGYATEGQAIYTMLVDYPDDVHVIVDGVAASAASLIAMAGDRITMRLGAWMLIHDPAQPFTEGRGTEADHVRLASELSVVSGAYADIYAKRAGITREAARTIMSAETVYDGPAAVTAGFATDHDPATASAVAATFDYRIYANAPQKLRDVSTPLAETRSKAAALAIFAGLPRSTKEETTMPPKTGATAVADKNTVDENGETNQKVATTATAPAPAQADSKAEIMAERARGRRITAAVTAAGLDAALAEKLIEDGTSFEDASDQITAAWKAKGDSDAPMAGRSAATITADARDKFVEGATKALMAKARMKAGERNEFSGLTLSEMAKESLTMSGDRQVYRSRQEMVGNALTMAGSHTTSDFANILSNVASASVLRGWEQADETFEAWTVTGTLPDFKEAKRVDAGFFEKLPKVPEGADYKYGTVGDRAETIALATYGKLFRITRQAIINDDMSVLDRIPMKMGRAARRTIGGLVYGVLTGNPNMSDGTALFHADHGNLAASGSGLSVTSLSAAIAAMKTQKAESEVLNIRPRYLIVGAGLEMVARQLLVSAVDPTATKGMALNPVAGAVELIVDARLEGTAWFLVADPASYDTIEVAYLDGEDQPYLEEQDMWRSDGVEMKVRIDAGVSPLDHRTFYKNAGA